MWYLPDEKLMKTLALFSKIIIYIVIMAAFMSMIKSGIDLYIEKIALGLIEEIFIPADSAKSFCSEILK